MVAPPTLSQSGGQGRAQVADDPVHLYNQRGVTEPLTFDLVDAKEFVVLEGQPGAARTPGTQRSTTSPARLMVVTVYLTAAPDG